MSVGDGALISPLSYLAVGREVALGTGVTTTAALDFLSASLKTTQEKKVLEEITRKRVSTKIINMGKTIEGDVEFYFYPEVPACNYIVQNGFGGSITTAVVSAASSFLHTYDVGSMNGTYTSLSMNHRKGEVTTGKIFEYSGLRVNELVFSAELDDALKVKASFMGFDSTVTANDVESAITSTCNDPLDFIGGRLSVEGTFASLTASSSWQIQNFELTLNNSLKGDTDSRAIGSDILTVLPVGMATIGMTAGLRFDTTTAFDAMISKTKLSAELEFLGGTITGSDQRRSLTLEMPVAYVNDAGDPEIGGPDEILKSEVTFNILHDCSSSGGYALRAIVSNGVADYN